MPCFEKYFSGEGVNLTSAYKCHEDAEKREYGHQVRNIEHGVFTPLVFTSTGGMEHNTTVFTGV